MRKSRERQIYIVTGYGSLVNLGLFLFKLVAGILGISAAMVADAFHSLSDFITDIIVVLFVRLSSKPADVTHSYGHGKFETLATVLVGISMGLVGLLILFHALGEILLVIKGDEIRQPEMIALWGALISILAKEILFHYTLAKGKALDSSAVIANAWHHRSDAMSSICTALGIGGAILLGGKWVILDPLAAAIVSIFIIIIGVRTIKPCLDDLLERSLPQTVIDEIVREITEVPGVGLPHNLQTRRIGNNYAIEFNMYIDPDLPLREAVALSSVVEEHLKNHFGRKTHVGIHFRLKEKS